MYGWAPSKSSCTGRDPKPGVFCPKAKTLFLSVKTSLLEDFTCMYIWIASDHTSLWVERPPVSQPYCPSGEAKTALLFEFSTTLVSLPGKAPKPSLYLGFPLLSPSTGVNNYLNVDHQVRSVLHSYLGCYSFLLVTAFQEALSFGCHTISFLQVGPIFSRQHEFESQMLWARSLSLCTRDNALLLRDADSELRKWYKMPELPAGL